MPQLPMYLLWLDVALTIAGGMVVLTALLHWARRSRRDPLRGSPIRLNTLGVPQVWGCLAAYIAGWWIGTGVASWYAPPGLSPSALEERRGIIGAVIAQTLVIGVCLAITRTSFRSGWRGLGLSRPGLAKNILRGIGGWAAALFLCGVILHATEYLIPIFFPEFRAPEHAVFRALQDPATSYATRVLAIVGAFLFAPVGEELLFRGVLQTALRRLTPHRAGSMLHRWVAIVIVGVIFGAMHSPMPHHIPALIALGILLGYVYERYGSLWVPITVHMLFNGKSLLWYELLQSAQ